MNAVVSMERSTTDVVGGALLAENAGAALDEIEQVSHQMASLNSKYFHDPAVIKIVSRPRLTRICRSCAKLARKPRSRRPPTSVAISKLSELASQLRRSVKGFRLPDEFGSTGILTQARVEGESGHGEDLAADEATDAEGSGRVPTCPAETGTMEELAGQIAGPRQP